MGIAASLKVWYRSYVDGELSAFKDEVRGYWIVYGRSRALFRSPAVIISAMLSIVLVPAWWGSAWPDLTISIVPNLLGFTLGSMAIILAFPGNRLFKFLSEDGREDSFYMEMSAKLVHFILVQVSAIVFALIGKAYDFSIIGFLGFFNLLYALSCAAMTAFALFGVAQLHNLPESSKILDEKDDKPS